MKIFGVRNDEVRKKNSKKKLFILKDTKANYTGYGEYAIAS